MKMLSYLGFLRNKYLVAALLFVGWILFFDKNDLFAQFQRNSELRELQRSKAYYQREIEKERKFSQDLKNNPATIEKFAREQYLMKRDNEDLFLIEPATEAEKD